MARGKHGYDHEGEFQESLRFAPTAGARARKLVSLENLAELIKENPDSAVVISDVHAQLPRLRETLERLRLVEAGERINKEIVLVQIGDLIDGRDLMDPTTLQEAAPWFDVVIAGNHEAAYLEGPQFRGYQFRPELTHQLKMMAFDGKLRAAHHAHGVLLTHAGLHVDHWQTELGAEKLAEAVNGEWDAWMQSKSKPRPYLFEIDGLRSSGNKNQVGGSLWLDWETLVSDLDPGSEDPKKSHDPSLKQIVGHTPRGRLEESLDGSCINIDLAGARLGVAVILPSGKIVTGSDRLT